MTTLYCLLFLMLITALTLVTFPFITTKPFQFKSYLAISSMLAIFSLALYQFSGDKVALIQWAQHGAEHYHLLEKFDQLGGIDGIIAQINERLKQHPNDAQGWYILSRLYQSKHDDLNAATALKRAQELSAP